MEHCIFRYTKNKTANIKNNVKGDFYFEKYIMALDAGTTSVRAIIYDENLNSIACSKREFTQIYPKPGYVEHDPSEVFACCYTVMTETILISGISAKNIAGIGITNQRETTVVWDKNTGAPVCNAIVWQCRRTADICKDIEANGYADYIKETTGLPMDAYFSASKIKWILDNVHGAREKAQDGDLLFGTIDTWIIWKLTEGKVHVTDMTNASRTMLFDINKLRFDDKLREKYTVKPNLWAREYRYALLREISSPRFSGAVATNRERQKIHTAPVAFFL